MESVLIVFNLAQRYDVIVNANQADVASDFWMRFIPQSACSANDMADNIRGIIHYGDSTGTPRTTQYDYVDDCEDMSADLLVPHVQIDVSSAHFYEEKEDVGLAFTAEGHIRWTVNGSSMEVQWGDPTVLRVANNDTSSLKPPSASRTRSMSTATISTFGARYWDVQLGHPT
jgi:hypothetical protein